VRAIIKTDWFKQRDREESDARKAENRAESFLEIRPFVLRHDAPL
jgi:hypothetical protein